ncbi:WD40 repeat domain-containing protein, partial [Planctomycetota bacterium]|nr:WD40 repeat domain-containing protein [Planctomycetota bacterium]
DPQATPPARDVDDPVPPLRLPEGELWHHVMTEFALSPDRRHAVSANETELRTWDLVERNLLVEIKPAVLVPELGEQVPMLASMDVFGFVDARSCAVRVQHVIFVLDVVTGQVIKRWTVDTLPDRDMAYAGGALIPGSRLLYFEGASVDGTGRSFDVLSGASEEGLVAPPGRNGQWIDESTVMTLTQEEEDDATRLTVWQRMANGWSPKNAGLLPRLDLAQALPWLAPNGLVAYVTTSVDCDLVRVDLVSGQVIHRRGRSVDSMCLTDDGRMFVSYVGNVDEIDPVTLNWKRSLRAAGDGSEYRPHLDVLESGALLVVDFQESTMCVWDPYTGLELSPHASRVPVASLAHSPNGNLLAVGHDTGEVALWDTAAGTRLHTVSRLRVENSSNNEGEPELWPLLDERLRAGALAVAFQDSDTVAVVTRTAQASALLYRIEASTGAVVGQHPLAEGDEVVGEASFATATPSLLLQSTTRTRVITLPTRRTISANLPPAQVAAISPDGGRVALRAPGERVVRVFDLAGNPVAEVTPPDEDGAHHLALAPNGTLLTANWSGIRAWDLTTGQERWQRELRGPLAFAGDGVVLGTFPGDGGSGERSDGHPATGLVVAVDVNTGATLATLMSEGQFMDVRALAASADGARLAGGSLEGGSFSFGAVLVWDLTEALRATGN